MPPAVIGVFVIIKFVTTPFCQGVPKLTVRAGFAPGSTIKTGVRGTLTPSPSTLAGILYSVIAWS